MKKYSNLILNFIGVYCRNIYKAGFLKNIDLEEEALLVNINENSNPILQYINPPWQRLLKNNKQLDVFNYKFITDNNAFLDSPSFILRLRSAGFKSIIYRIFLSIYQKKIFKNVGNDFFVYKENELIKESSFELIKNMNVVKKIDIKNFDKNSNPYNVELENNIIKFLDKNLKLLLHSRFSHYLEDKILENLLCMLLADLKSSMILHDNYLIEWSKSLNFSKNKKIVLTNFPGRG